MYELSRGALLTISNGGTVPPPVLQVLDVKRLPESHQDRFRLTLSDGMYSNSFATLASQLNYLVHRGELCEKSLVRLTRYSANCWSGKKIIIVVDLDVLIRGTEVVEPVTAGLFEIDNYGDVREMPLKRVEDIRDIHLGDSQRGGKRMKLTSQSFFAPTPSEQALCSFLVIPIVAVNPYQKGWTVLARVTKKSNIKSWGKDKDGKVFSADLVDETGEIRISVFNQQCDHFFTLLKVGQVFTFSGCSVRDSDSKFTGLAHNYEMCANEYSQIKPFHSETPNIPSLQFHFKKIAEIQNLESDQCVDVLAICSSWSEVVTVTSKAQERDFLKRELTLVDSSFAEVRLTLWESQAKDFVPDEDFPVVAIKGARTVSFSGISLSMSSNGTFQLNPNLPEAEALRRWYFTEGQEASLKSLTQKMSPSNADFMGNFKASFEIIRGPFSSRDKGKYEMFSTLATVAYIKQENLLYKGCSNVVEGKSCNKKLIDQRNGMFLCEKCNNERNTYNWRIILVINLVDATGSFWATCFQNEAEHILGETASRLGSAYNSNSTLARLVESRLYNRFMFRVRSTVEAYNGNLNVKHTVVGISEVHFSSYMTKISEDLEAHGQQPTLDRYVRSLASSRRN